MKRINYKSDFDFVLKLLDADGNAIGWPAWNWKLVVYVKNNRSSTFEASCKDGECANCFNDNGDVHIVCDSHGLGTGILYGEFYADLDNPIYADDMELTVTPFPLGITLVSSAGDLPKDFEIQNTVPYVYASAYSQAVAAGYTGTEAEFTEALATMPQAVADANAATDGVKALAQAVDEAEQAREDAEGKRVASENARRNSETSRTNAENARVSAEAARVEAEEGRAEAEQARELAETARANAEDGREGAESARQTAESKRAWNEDVRVAAENARVEAESERVEAETSRVTEFATIKTDTAAEIAAVQQARESLAEFEQTVADTQKLVRDLAQYDELEPIVLTSAQANKAVGVDGKVVSKSGYAVSQKVRMRKGNIYLYRTEGGTAIDMGVALCSMVVTKPTAVVVDYEYTYDEQERIVTAVAVYDPTKTYTYTYDGDTVTITDSEGNEVDDLPTYRMVDTASYAPLFTALSETVPRSGYYAVVCIEDCEAIWSAPAPLQTVLVVSYGVLRSIANNKADRAELEKTKTRLDAMEESVCTEDYRKLGWNLGKAMYMMGKCETYDEFAEGVAKSVALWDKYEGVMPKDAKYTVRGGAVYLPDFDYSNTTSLAYMCFLDWSTDNTTLKYIERVSAENATSATYAFYRTYALLEVGTLDLPNLKYAGSMFNLAKMKHIGKFYAPNVITLNSTFNCCDKLVSLPKIDTPLVTDFYRAFRLCSVLPTLDVNFRSVTGMSDCFDGDTKLMNLTVREIGTSELATYDFRDASKWGTDTDAARQTLVDSLITYSYDRVAAGLEAVTVRLSAATMARLTEDEIAQITAKGFNLTN